MFSFVSILYRILKKRYMEEDIKKEEQTVSPDAVEGAVVETPKGRAAILAKYKESNPESGDDIEDDALYDYAMGRLSESDEKYNSLAGANTRLAELTGADPKLAGVLSMIAGDDAKSLPYAIAKTYGKDFLSLEGDALEDFEKGYQENLKEVSQSKEAIEKANENIEQYQATLSEFGKENELKEEDVEKLNEAIYNDAINMLNGIIPKEFIEYKWKGLNYDKDVETAAESGMIEGKNEVIEAKMKSMKEVAPAGGGSTSQKKVGSSIPKRKRGSFYDNIKEVKL